VGHTLESFSGDVRAEVRFLVDSYKFSEGIEKIWSLIRAIDQLLTENAPSEVANNPSDARRVTAVMNDACEGLALVALLLHPFLPQATDAIWKSLGQTTRLEDQVIDDSPWGCLTPGTPVGKLEPLFPEENQPQSAAN
jgi:methionyl-tRNA synthetase